MFPNLYPEPWKLFLFEKTNLECDATNRDLEPQFKVWKLLENSSDKLILIVLDKGNGIFGILKNGTLSHNKVTDLGKPLLNIKTNTFEISNNR